MTVAERWFAAHAREGLSLVAAWDWLKERETDRLAAWLVDSTETSDTEGHMAAGTAVKRERLADQIAIINMEAERAGQLAAAAQTLAKRMAKGHRPSIDEKRVFQLNGWDKPRIDREVSRWETVSRWEEKAGTAESRAAAVTEQAAASAAERKEGPEIDAKIAELKRQREALSNRVRIANQAVEGHRVACDSLRELLPEEERRDWNERRADLNERFIEIPQLENEIGVVRKLRTLSTEERRHHAESMRREGVHLIDRVERRFFRGGWRERDEAIRRYGSEEAALAAVGSAEIHESVNETRWMQYVADRESALPGLEQRLAELRAAKAEATAKIDAALTALIPE